MSFILHILSIIGIFSILAFGYHFIFRMAGMLSLAYGNYFAIGAYAYALGSLSVNRALWITLVLGLLICLAVSLLEALLSWRLRADSFFLGSLALQAIVYSTALNWANVGSAPGTLTNLTNGAFGLPGIRKPGIAGIQFDTAGSFFVLVACLSLLAYFAFRNLTNSPFGRITEMARDDEIACAALGKSPRFIRLRVLLVGSLFGYIGGILYAAQNGYVDPDVALLNQTISILAMVVTGSLFGSRSPLIGVSVLVILPEILRFARLSSALAADIQVLAYGLLLVLVAHASKPQSRPLADEATE